VGRPTNAPTSSPSAPSSTGSAPAGCRSRLPTQRDTAQAGHRDFPDPRSVNPALGEALARLIVACLALDPGARPGSAAPCGTGWPRSCTPTASTGPRRPHRLPRRSPGDGSDAASAAGRDPSAPGGGTPGPRRGREGARRLRRCAGHGAPPSCRARPPGVGGPFRQAQTPPAPDRGRPRGGGVGLIAAAGVARLLDRDPVPEVAPIAASSSPPRRPGRPRSPAGR